MFIKTIKPIPLKLEIYFTLNSIGRKYKTKRKMFEKNIVYERRILKAIKYNDYGYAGE